MITDGGESQNLVNALFRLAKVVERKSEGLIVAEVTVALPLDEDDREKLEKALKALTRKEVEIREIVDRKIIGGIIVKLRDRVFNDSVAGNLEKIRANIAAGLENV